MEEQVIEFDTAKLAKEKGFPQNDHWTLEDSYYLSHPDGRRAVDSDIYDEELDASSLYEIAKPTQSLLQKWLRDKHNIIVQIEFNTEEFGYRIFNPFKSKDHFSDIKLNMWNYEEALENGLQDALGFI